MSSSLWVLISIVVAAGLFVSGILILVSRSRKRDRRSRLRELDQLIDIALRTSAENSPSVKRSDKAYLEELHRVQRGDRANTAILGSPSIAVDFDLSPSATATERIDNDVQFTVYRPSTIVPQLWYTVLAFAHLSKPRPDADIDEPHPVQEMQRLAAKVLSDQPAQYESTKLDRGFSVPRRGHLTFVPLIEGCEFNPPYQSVRWQRGVHKVEFEMTASSSVDGREVEGQMTVYLGNIILTEVPLRINVDSQYLAPKTREVVFKEASAEPYRKIFASYSHQDTEIVEDFEDYVQALGDEYLRDVKTLRAGQVWCEELERMIREANVFQLFWSSNSMPSKFVRQEWEYALGLNRPKFIRPVYWEDPLPETKPDLPPESLRRLHFYKFPKREEEKKPAAAPPMTSIERDWTPSSGISTQASEAYIDDEPTDSAGFQTQDGFPPEPPESSPYSSSRDQHLKASVVWYSGLNLKLASALLGVALISGLAYVGYLRLDPFPIPALSDPTPTPTAKPPPSSPTPSPHLSPTPKPTRTATSSVPAGPAAVRVLVEPTVRVKAEGASGEYYLIVRNESSRAIRNVEVRENLPPDLEYVSSDPEPVSKHSQVIVWRFSEVGASPDDRFASIKINFRLRRALHPGERLKSEHTIVYTDANGNRVTNKFVLTPVRVPAG